MAHQYVSEHFPTERSARAKIVLGILADKFPTCFHIYERRRKPLALGIHNDIIAAIGDAIAPRDLSAALRCYVANRGYLRHCVVGAARISWYIWNTRHRGEATISYAWNDEIRGADGRRVRARFPQA